MSSPPDNHSVPDYADLLRVDGKGIVILGGGQGIGRQACHAFAQMGARVVVVDLEADRAATVVDELGDVAIPWVGDITERDEVERLTADSRQALGGRVDGIVDIVGMAQYASIVDTTDELWDWEHDIVLRHAWLAMQSFGRIIAADGGGTMTFVASVSGIAGAQMHAAYGAFKAALMALVRSAAVEMGPVGVRVNAVAPGVVWTPRVAELAGEEGHLNNAAHAPVGRVALPSDIAAALLFLSSDLAGYVSGHTLVVDGGVLAKFGYPMPGPND
jgi:NAD(P)-dependent dehydrogenase (short-subunit alcohol dehydrogenase family)